jgi:hypothetical protein
VAAPAKVIYYWGYPLVDVTGRTSQWEVMKEPGRIAGLVPAAPMGYLSDYLPRNRRLVHNWLVRLVRTARADSLRTAEVLRPARRPEAKGAQASDLHTCTVGPVGLDPTICEFDIPDSPSTRHAPRGNSGGYDSDRKPVSSANVPAKTSGGPRRARTDDLRI